MLDWLFCFLLDQAESEPLYKNKKKKRHSNPDGECAFLFPLLICVVNADFVACKYTVGV